MTILALRTVLPKDFLQKAKSVKLVMKNARFVQMKPLVLLVRIIGIYTKILALKNVLQRFLQTLTILANPAIRHVKPVSAQIQMNVIPVSIIDIFTLRPAEQIALLTNTIKMTILNNVYLANNIAFNARGEIKMIVHNA